MPRPILLCLVFGFLLAACGGGGSGGGSGAGPQARGCDDGGSGGVMIDGVCL